MTDHIEAAPDVRELVGELAKLARNLGYCGFSSVPGRAATTLTTLSAKCAEQAAEIERLRGALIQAGRNAGAGLADDVSTDFLMHVPEEVRLVVERLKGDYDDMVDTAHQNRKWAEERHMAQIETFARAVKAEADNARLRQREAVLVAALEGLRFQAWTTFDGHEDWKCLPEAELQPALDVADTALSSIRDGQQTEAANA
jgi:hypothetical protein